MKKQLFLIFLILVSWAQSGTIVTHYDLDGNLISEEFQQAIEEETLNVDDSMELQSDAQGNQLFEIEPMVSKSAEQETSTEYQQYQQQEKERQEQLQQITQQDNLDWSAGLDEVPTQQLSDKQEESSSLESDAQLQPTVASQDSVINIQQPVEEPIVNENSAQIDANDLAIPSIIPETPQAEVLDMPTQQQIQEEKVENQVEQIEKQDNQVEQVEQVVEEVESVEKQVEQVDQQSVPIVENFKALETENQETITVEQIPKLQQDMISTEDQEMQSKMQEINPKEEENEQPTINEQEAIPQKEEKMQQSEAVNTMIPSDEEKMQPSQIEEDIKFDTNQKADSVKQEEVEEQPQQSQEVIENQKNNDLPLENQKTNDLPIENQKSTDLPIENPKTEAPVQEIAQDFPLAKEQEPEKQVDLSNQENENIKQANQIQQSKCIIIYSECDYQGYALEACDSLQQIEQFKHKIQSIYIPQGYGLTIYENENFNGHSHRYTSSQQCLQQQAVSFIQFSTTLSRQNLRSRI